jgi:hypothetical protein
MILGPMNNTSGNAPGRNTSLFPLGTGLQMLGLSLMAGGMLALGAFTAPVVFHQFPRDMAAPAMALIFRRYDVVLLVALGLVIVGELLRRLTWTVQVRSKLLWTRMALLVVLSVCMLYSTLVVNAKIAEMNKAGWHRNLETAKGREFDSMHKRSESLYKLELMLVVLLILLTPFGDARLHRSLSAAAFESSGPSHD